MENNEIMVNEEIEVIENAELIEAQDIPEESGSGIGKAVLLVGGTIALIGAGAAAVLKFTKKKRTEWKIKQLEKQGYEVYKPEEIEAIEEPVVDNEDEEVIEVDE